MLYLQYFRIRIVNFSKLFRTRTNGEYDEGASYDAEKIITIILVPVQKTVDYIPRRTFQNDIEQFSKKECVFPFTIKIRNHFDRCPIRGSISVVFCYVYVSKMEGDIVVLIKPLFIKDVQLSNQVNYIVLRD